jgi:hypothetical protein
VAVTVLTYAYGIWSITHKRKQKLKRKNETFECSRLFKGEPNTSTKITEELEFFNLNK